MSYTVTHGLRGGNICFGKAGIGGLSGAATTFTTANQVYYAVNGKAASKAALTATAVPTTDGATGAAFKAQLPSTVCCYAFGLLLDGTVKVVQGTIVPYTDTSANSTVVPLPALPDTITAFAYAVIKAGSTVSTSWTFGTSNWNATGITIDTPVDVCNLPPTDPITA
jgi:hypothetical protein